MELPAPGSAAFSRMALFALHFTATWMVIFRSIFDSIDAFVIGIFQVLSVQNLLVCVSRFADVSVAISPAAVATAVIVCNSIDVVAVCLPVAVVGGGRLNVPVTAVVGGTRSFRCVPIPAPHVVLHAPAVSIGSVLPLGRWFGLMTDSRTGSLHWIDFTFVADKIVDRLGFVWPLVLT